MSDMALLSNLALVERAINFIEQQIDDAKAACLTATAFDASGLTIQSIDALARVFRARGYRVQKSTGVTHYDHCYPLLRLAWNKPDPQRPLFE